MIRDAGEDPAEPGFGIGLVHTAGFNKRVGGGGCVTAAL